jgi:plasmid stabilization system protein ParE
MPFVAVDHPAYAKRLRRAILGTIQQISERPYLGIRNARAPELRSRLISRFPYRIPYMIGTDEITIVHVRHTARRAWEPPRSFS